MEQQARGVGTLFTPVATTVCTPHGRQVDTRPHLISKFQPIRSLTVTIAVTQAMASGLRIDLKCRQPGLNHESNFQHWHGCTNKIHYRSAEVL
jgi:hypothetical protein